MTSKQPVEFTKQTPLGNERVGNQVVITSGDEPIEPDNPLAGQMIARWGSGDGEIDEVRIDAATNSLQTVSYEHHEIHSGSHYFFENFVTLNNGVAIDFGIQTPNVTKWTHIVWQIQSQAEITFQIYEGATIVFDGTDLTSFNNNRNSANVSNWVEFQSDPTVNAVGTLLAQTQVGSATNPNTGVPGGGQRDKEIILKQNTVYLFRITSGTNSNTITYLAEWYEHTHRH